MSGEGSLFDVPPAAIGRFRVLHQVGAGTSGPVFRGVHPETGVPLAIKLFALSFAPERLAGLVEALEALVRRLPLSDGTCEPLDAGLHGTTPFLAAAFAPGDSLDVALKQFGPATLIDLVPRLRTLAGALDAAADVDILHGALHPRDVLVSDTSTRLTGLGAWPILARHGARMPVRRPYRALDLPETAVSAAGDRFALAALAFEWMTGRRAPAAFVAGDMVALPGVDREALGRVFAQALHADPDERYASCEAFVDALAAVEVEDLPVPAPTDAAPVEERGRRRGSRARSVPTLPLDAFPPEEAADLDLAPAMRAEPGEPPREPADVVLEPSRPAAPIDEAATHAASTIDGSSPTLLVADAPRDVPASGRSASSGVARFSLGLLLGMLVGVGAGYALWGRAAPVQPMATVPAIELQAPPPVPPVHETSGANSVSAPAPTAGGAVPSVPEAKPLAAPPVPTGSLLVRSTPAGATVLVDEARRGVTPLSLQKVELGTRRVRIQRDGFTTEERQITLTRSRPSRTIEVRLTRVSPSAREAAGAPAPAAKGARTGSLLIESRPTGAAVVLNGRRVGNTPMTIDDLEPGTYTVQLQLPTHRPVTTTARVVAGERARAAASLVSVQEP